jgi:hypothetical protein
MGCVGSEKERWGSKEKRKVSGSDSGSDYWRVAAVRHWAIKECVPTVHDNSTDDVAGEESEDQEMVT